MRYVSLLFLYFTSYIFSASVGLLWSKCLLQESFECKPRDKGLTCFNVKDKKEFDCPLYLSQSTNDDATHINTVCQISFCLCKAFVAAAGLFAGVQLHFVPSVSLLF